MGDAEPSQQIKGNLGIHGPSGGAAQSKPVGLGCGSQSGLPSLHVSSAADLPTGG